MMKVEIIGAGIAGSFTALHLAKLGHDVIIYNSKYEPLPAKCGEGIWEKLLLNVGIKPDKKYIDNTTSKAKIGFEINKKIKFLYIDTECQYLTLDRQKFEKELISRARKKGAIINFNENMKSFHENTDFKIGAWGTTPITLYSKIYSSYQFGYQFLMENIDVENCKTVILTKNHGSRYIWIFPKGKNRANVGIMTSFEKSGESKKILTEFVKSTPELKDGKIVREIGKLISANPPLKKEHCRGNVILIGDAGGFCNTISGGGIGNALFSAKMCAEAIGSEIPIKSFFDKTSELRIKLQNIYSVYNKFYNDKKRVEKMYLFLKNKDKIGSISNIVYELYK